MTSSHEFWRDNSLNTAIVVVAILIAGMVAGWVGYERSSSPPSVEMQSQAPVQPCGESS